MSMLFRYGFFQLSQTFLHPLKFVLAFGPNLDQFSGFFGQVGIAVKQVCLDFIKNDPTFFGEFDDMSPAARATKDHALTPLSTSLRFIDAFLDTDRQSRNDVLGKLLVDVVENESSGIFAGKGIRIQIIDHRAKISRGVLHDGHALRLSPSKPSAIWRMAPIAIADLSHPKYAEHHE